MIDDVVHFQYEESSDELKYRLPCYLVNGHLMLKVGYKEPEVTT